MAPSVLSALLLAPLAGPLPLAPTPDPLFPPPGTAVAGTAAAALRDGCCVDFCYGADEAGPDGSAQMCYRSVGTCSGSDCDSQNDWTAGTCGPLEPACTSDPLSTRRRAGDGPAARPTASASRTGGGDGAPDDKDVPVPLFKTLRGLGVRSPSLFSESVSRVLLIKIPATKLGDETYTVKYVALFHDVVTGDGVAGVDFRYGFQVDEDFRNFKPSDFEELKADPAAPEWNESVVREGDYTFSVKTNLVRRTDGATVPGGNSHTYIVRTNQKLRRPGDTMLRYETAAANE